MKDLYDDMRVMEKIITHSTLDWTLIRASNLQDRPATGNYRISEGSNPHTRMETLPRRPRTLHRRPARQRPMAAENTHAG